MNQKVNNQSAAQTSDGVDRPYLRALKCAYKLHKAGVTKENLAYFFGWASAHVDAGRELPSAALSPASIVMCMYTSIPESEETQDDKQALGLICDDLGFKVVA